MTFRDMRYWIAAGVVGCTLVATAICQPAAAAAPRTVYNPVTGRTEAATRPAPSRQPARATQSAATAVTPAQYSEQIATPYDMGMPSYGPEMGAELYHGGSGAEACGSCCDSVGCGGCSPAAKFYAGFEAVFVKPRFENNVAYTVMESNGSTTESFRDTEFDYDLDFSPRVFLGWRHCDGIGLRANWWHFDHAAASADANPAANGFGRIIPPAFGDVDISSNIPTDTYGASTDLEAYAVDIEATKETQFCSWDFGVGCGVRYAYVEQGYLGRLTDTGDDLIGQIDYRHSLEGFGPTISAHAVRSINCQTGLFCKARGSLLYGDAESSMAAGEDLDLTTPFNTTRTTSRDDLLTIAEIQVGLQWHSNYYRVYQPFLSVAMEGQVWNGAGNATSEEGSLGFFGFNTGAGLQW